MSHTKPTDYSGFANNELASVHKVLKAKTMPDKIILNATDHPVGTRFLVGKGRGNCIINEMGIIEWSPEGCVKIKPGPIWYRPNDMPDILEILQGKCTTLSPTEQISRWVWEDKAAASRRAHELHLIRRLM